jgi:hypothetical protein
MPSEFDRQLLADGVEAPRRVVSRNFSVTGRQDELHVIVKTIAPKAGQRFARKRQAAEIRTDLVDADYFDVASNWLVPYARYPAAGRCGIHLATH